jgi:cell division transport system permease protein
LKINFLFKESLRGLNTAKLSTLASVITITLSLILIAIYYIVSVNSNKLIKSVKDKVEIEVFLDDSITQDELSDLREKIRTIGGVKQITYISKDEAAKIFTGEFGSDMLDIFESNPLPASLKINLYDEYKYTERMNKIKAQINTMKKVQDIVYPEKNLEMIEKNSSGLLLINLLVLIVISLSSIFLVSNTIRLVISSKKKILELFKLLGAKNSFIITPFLIGGFIQGLIGGLLAVAAIYGFYFLFTSKFSTNELKIEFIGIEYIIALIISGIFLGILGSVISVKFFLKKERLINY